jgi:ABC-2 type transport system ATP-binding protein
MESAENVGRNPAECLLEAHGLIKHYGKVVAVNGVSLQLQGGTCFGLLGPNGAGKSTTIEMLEGVLPPTAGTILYRGQSLGPRFRQEAGIQFQRTSLQEFLTVRETVALFHGLYEHTLPIDEVLRLCALEELAGRDNKKLSGGQQQRLLLAVALVNDPAILFLDEPTTGLDPQARRAFWALVQGIKARGTTVMLSTHYMDEAYVLCDRIAIMDHGRFLTEGTPRGLLEEHFGVGAAERPGPEGRPYNLEDLFLKLTGRDLRA